MTNSNTTLVKVKLYLVSKNKTFAPDSNTTLVKVKLKKIDVSKLNARFKYNTC